MLLKETLELFLITHNREQALRRTIGRLLCVNSPVREISLHVLDNKSTDGTHAVVKEFATHHTNLHYICNKYNIGLGGNIIKAMEMATKPYFWILCDDDDFNWAAWPEIEKALLSGQYDIIMTTYTEGFRNETIPYLINEMNFVPSAIYKTAHIDNTVMINAYAMAHNLFPFHALSTKIINNHGKIFVPQKRMVLQNYGKKSHSITQLKPRIYRRLQTFSLLWGMVDAYSLLEDRKLRYACMNVLCLGHSFLESINIFCHWFPFSWQNLFDIFYYVSWKQKLQILLILLIIPIRKISPIDLYRTDRGINIRLFWVIKNQIPSCTPKNKKF